MTETLSHTSSGPPEAEVEETSPGPPRDEFVTTSTLPDTPPEILLRHIASDTRLLHFVDEGIKTILLTYFSPEICRDRSHPVGHYVGQMLDLLTRSPHDDAQRNELHRQEIEAIQRILEVLVQGGIPAEDITIEHLVQLGKEAAEEMYDEDDY